MSSRRPLIAVLTTLAFAAAMSAQAGTAFGATTGHASRAAQEPGTRDQPYGNVTRTPGATAHASGAAAHVPRPTATRPAPGARVTRLPAPRQQATGSSYEPLPNLPVNACQDSTLPRDYGTNFPVPRDPNGFGFANQTVIGWEGNYYAPFAYLSGAYFARGVPAHFTQGSTTFCGAMYSFDVYKYGLSAGQAPPPGSVHWTMADGYLPAMTTSFTRDDVAISITDFADRQTINGSPVELVYTRVRVTNRGTSNQTVPAGQSGPNLVALNRAPDTVAPGATVNHDFAAAVDTFGTPAPLPGPDALAPGSGHDGALSYDRAFGHMTS